MKETVKTIVYAGLIALGIRSFLFEPFTIPSGSMLETLLIGDFLFVSKYSYGYSRHSLPFGLPLIPGPGRLFGEGPERGDVAVFKNPMAPKIDFVKRVVGLPGDTVQLRSGRLFINGAPVARDDIGPASYRDKYGIVKHATRYRETLPNGRSYEILEESDSGPADNTSVFKVPEGHYFALGDNRDNSTDSRFTGHVGYIPAENFVGRAEILFFSLDHDTSFWEFWRYPGGVRWERIFDAIGP